MASREQGHLLLLGWLCCPRPEEIPQVLHCGPSLPGPLLPSYGLPKVCDLLAVEQGLPHNLLLGMCSGLTSLWGCSCLNASKQATTRRRNWML